MRSAYGYTFLELLVVTSIIGLAALLLMPALQGYQNNAQVRAQAALVVTQARQAESDAISEEQEITWWIYGNGTQPQSWVVRQGFGATISSVTVNPPLDLTGCYRNTFLPNGTVSPAGPCEGNPVLACVDNGQHNAPYALEVTVANVTGQISVQQLSVLCPDI